ncbi:MAG: hypothetical protein Q4C52_05940 [Eubacteriales bacterium]|nr:hypothetical protein [Eubacteriales bacterium]
MLDLTFGEQVKIILSRKGMTIKELAETIEERTGKKMSRQNLTQRLGRDNFQEQDMRMIADILECPFQLSILADSEAVERASNIGDVPPTEKELSKLAKAKARREKKVKEEERLADAMEQIPSEIEGEVSEKEMTLGDYIAIHEELERQETDRLPKIEEESVQAMPEVAVAEELVLEMAVAEEPVPESADEEESVSEEEPREPQRETYRNGPSISDYIRSVSESEEHNDVEEVLRELEEMEKETEHSQPNTSKVQEERRQETKKITGWRAMFQRRPRRERQEELREEEKIEQEILAEPVSATEDHIEYEEPEEEIVEVQEEPAAEPEEEIAEEEDEAEDLSRGEVNPYTGHEYESNSVRMHPKRIGYVQVYDRRDHAWTDMTEWAFLGYQERKKALLGRDYEPPIYLD